MLNARFSPAENLRRVGSLALVISVRPLADLSPARVDQGFLLSRKRKNTRAEALMMRAYSSANFLNIVFAVEYELSSGKYVLSKETLHCAVSITNICTFVLVLLQLLTSTRMERRSTVGGSW